MTMLTLAAAPPQTQTNWCNLLPPGSRSPSSLLSPGHGGRDHGGGDGGGHDHSGGDGDDHGGDHGDGDGHGHGDDHGGGDTIIIIDSVFLHIYILSDANPDVNFIVPGKVIKVPEDEQIIYFALNDFGFDQLVVNDENSIKGIAMEKSIMKWMGCDVNDFVLNYMFSSSLLTTTRSPLFSKHRSLAGPHPVLSS